MSYTLPIWVTAAAKAATSSLFGHPFVVKQSVELPDGNEHPIVVSVQSASVLSGGKRALGISFCDPGEGLDITRDLEIWVLVQAENKTDFTGDWLNLVPGNGVGKYKDNGEICLSKFALELLKVNLRPLVPFEYLLNIEVVFPLGSELALRTSNHAFGVVDGLSLIGTQAEVQVSSSPEQLRKTLHELSVKCSNPMFNGNLIFVIGENGLQLTKNLGINSDSIVKVGNWIGPLLVAAAEDGVKQLLLIGYHGKLVKLAGGIFHTHYHLADGRLETLIALAVKEGLPLSIIQSLGQAESMNSALQRLKEHDSDLAQKLWSSLACKVEMRTDDYVRRYGNWAMSIGAALFDRQQKLCWIGPKGKHQLTSWGIALDTR